MLAFSFRAWYNNYMSGISYTSPDISNHMLETFARRVYVPVIMAGVAVLSMLITSLVVRVALSLLFFHMGVPSWAHALTIGLWTGGGWGIVALPFLYVVLGSFYGYAQKKEIEQLEHPISSITAVAKLVYSVIYRIAVYALTGMDSTLLPATEQGAYQIQSRQAASRRETRGRPPRLRLGRPGTTKEAGHVRLSMRTYTVAVTTAGGSRI